MWQTIVLSVLGGLVAGNGLPHFLRGITRRRYPCALGNGPIPNLAAGWAGLVLGALLVWWAHVGRYPELSLASISAGVLLIGLFHAGPGAFGRQDGQDAAGKASAASMAMSTKSRVSRRRASGLR